MASDKPGPFDPLLRQAAETTPEHDRAVVYVIGTIIGLALLLLVLVLPPISILSRGGGDSPASGASASDSASSHRPKARCASMAATSPTGMRRNTAHGSAP